MNNLITSHYNDTSFTNQFDDLYNPIIRKNKMSTIIYYTIRNNVSYFINNPLALNKLYVRVYNQTFQSNKGVK